MKSEMENFPIVGIGASAGGLKALESLFNNWPGDERTSFLIVQHLEPKQKSLLPELIQKATTLKVVPVTNRLKIRPNCIYIIPSSKYMSVSKRTIYLSDLPPNIMIKLPIDFLFSSLAEDLKDKSIGIILSGMGSDGSQGAKAIKEQSGLILAQDTVTAEFNSMPNSVINSVSVDVVAPVEKLMGKLQDIWKSTPGETTVNLDHPNNKFVLDKILILLRIQTGNDFSEYKNNTLYRRIERRMGVHKLQKISDYHLYLQKNPMELDLLFKELLIGVTQFFRDSALWEKLKDNILPNAMKKLPPGYSFRAWIPGCSTGEEAFSLAIILKEVQKTLIDQDSLTFQLFATDLDPDAIEKARKGCFDKTITKHVSAERLEKYFLKTQDGYRINSEIRKMVVFAPQNVIKDPPFSKLDILTCRNMLIYMEPELQTKLLSLFHYCLNSEGILVLGNSETLGPIDSFYNPLDSKLRIYLKHQKTKRPGPMDFPSSYNSGLAPLAEKEMSIKITDKNQNHVDQMLIQRFGLSSVVTNVKGDILYITGKISPFLEPAAGKASMNIFVMAQEGLRNELVLAFHRACQSYDKVYISYDQVDVTIQKLDSPQELQGMLLVVFSKAKVNFDELKNKLVGLNRSHDSSYKQLQEELVHTKEELQLTIEEMKTSQEELHSTNEELQSTNEEMQSSNEELTTSTEEMQSLNQELQSVNLELMTKVDEYTSINGDLKNLLDSTNIATLFLDKFFHIRRFTQQATQVFKLIPTDIGRPFTDIVTNLNYERIYDDVKEVLRTLVVKEKTIDTKEGVWYNVRIMPYRTLDDRIDGLVLTFNDISKLKLLEISLREKERSVRTFFEGAPVGFSNHQIIFDDQGRVIDFLFIEANKRYQEMIGLDPQKKMASEIFPGIIKDPLKYLVNYSQVAMTGKEWRFELYIKHCERWFDCISYQSELGHFAIVYLDVSERKMGSVNK